MGYAIAAEAARRGADVTLVSGPTALADPAGVTTVRVESARSMMQECESRFGDTDIAIMSAAVADYAPKTFVDHKIKR